MTQETTRREFIAGACAIATLAFTGLASLTPAEAATGIKRRSDGRVEVTVAKVSALAKNGGAVNLGTVKGNPVALVRVNATTYRAYNLRCTHEGVTVRKSGSKFVCPGHGAEFTATTGTVTRGPASRNLAKVKVVFANGVVTVG